MLRWRFSTILAAASAGGAFLLTLISGLYAVKPFIVDAEIIYYGFPSAWLEAARSGLLKLGPWHYNFLWHGFLIDFILYGLLIAAIVYVYFMLLPRK